MSTSWQQSFEHLQDFISKQPEIQISGDAVCLPDSVRPDFYRALDMVRSSFIKENFSIELAEATEFGLQYTELKKRLCVRLNIKEIEINAWLNWFIKDPVDCLNRVLFDPLFDLLKNKINPMQFEKHAFAVVRELYDNLMHMGYDRWCTLALIEAMGPDAAYIVPVEDNTTQPDLTDAAHVPGSVEAFLPEIEKAEILPLNHTPFTSLLVPKIIVHLPTSDTYVALRTDYHTVYRRERSLKESSKWVKTADIVKDFGKNDLWPDLGIYLDSKMESLILIADYYNITMPDLIVEYAERPDWYANGGAQSAIRHYEVTKPRLGSFIICRKPLAPEVMDSLKPKSMPESVPLESSGEALTPSVPVATTPASLSALPEGITIIVAGYDVNLLYPIVSALRPRLAQPESGS